MKDLKNKDATGVSENTPDSKTISEAAEKVKNSSKRKNKNGDFFKELDVVVQKYNAQICLAYSNSKVQIIIISR